METVDKKSDTRGQGWNGPGLCNLTQGRSTKVLYSASTSLLEYRQSLYEVHSSDRVQTGP